MSQYESKLEKYGHKGIKIGSGVYSKVYIYKNKNKKYAVKVMGIGDPDEGIDSSTINDIGSLKYLDHPNIVKVIDTIITKNKVYMVMDLAISDITSLYNSQEYNKRDIPKLFYPLVNAMGYYFNMNILHLDIKPQNILYFPDGLKFTDFGLSKIGYCNVYPESMYTNVVTLWYRSINLFLGDEHYDTMVDIWAFGCVLYEMYTGKVLFQGNSALDMVLKICRRLGTPNEKTYPGVTSLPEWSNNFPQYVHSGFGDIKSNPRLLDLLNTIFNYSNFSKHNNSDHITQILYHPYFDSARNKNVNFKSLSCMESLYNYDNYIKNGMRDNNINILMSWIIEVAIILKLSVKILFLSYYIMDNFLSQINVELKNLQLLAITSVHLASLMCDIFPPQVDDYLIMVDKRYTRKEFLEFKNKIIELLDWKIYHPTSFSFLDIMSTVSMQHYKVRKCILLQLYRTEFIFEHKPSVIAQIVNELAYIYIGEFDFVTLDSTFFQIPHITKKDPLIAKITKIDFFDIDILYDQLLKFNSTKNIHKVSYSIPYILKNNDTSACTIPKTLI